MRSMSTLVRLSVSSSFQREGMACLALFAAFLHWLTFATNAAHVRNVGVMKQLLQRRELDAKAEVGQECGEGKGSGGRHSNRREWRETLESTLQVSACFT